MHWGYIISALGGYYDLCEGISSVHWGDIMICVGGNHKYIGEGVQCIGRISSVH